MQGENPRDNAERLRLAYRAHEKGQYVAAARLFGEVLDSDTAVGEDRKARHRYNAACAAALAASGHSKDEPSLNDASKLEVRNQARTWLEAELITWSKILESVTPEQRGAIAKTLEHWLEDPDLKSVRDADALEALSETKRAAWKNLWDEVDALLAKAKHNAGAEP